MGKTPTMPAPFEEFMQTGSRITQTPTIEEPPVVAYANDSQLRLCRQSLIRLIELHNLAKYAIMRQIGLPSRQLCDHFAEEQRVPIEQLLRLATLFVCRSINDFITLPDRTSERHKVRRLCENADIVCKPARGRY